MEHDSAARAGAARRKRFWFDPRFGIGLALIAASVVGVVAIVAATDSSVQVLVARGALLPGDVLAPGDLDSRSVSIDGAHALYLLPDDIAEDGVVVTRPVSAGEFVPASAVGSTVGIRQSSVVITVDGPLAASVTAGSTVDVWASRESGVGQFGPPVVLVSNAVVVRIVDAQGIVVSDRSAPVEILVPRTRIARVLEALANDDVLSIVPTSLPAKG